MQSLFPKSITFAILFSIFSTVFQTGLAQASQFLNSGSGPILLPGSTAAIEADLGGTVVQDRLIPFAIRGVTGALLFQGTLQDRVVKSNRFGDLHFYLRIRDTKAGLNGIVARVFSKSFATTPKIFVDWGPDGLGAINPISAQRSSGLGEIVSFNFASPQILVGGRESKFFFVKTNATQFRTTGATRIQLTSGEFVVLQTSEPM